MCCRLVSGRVSILSTHRTTARVTLRRWNRTLHTENIYHLCQQFLDAHSPRCANDAPYGVDGFAVFISNAAKAITMSHQRAGGPQTMGLVCWDYHVVFLEREFAGPTTKVPAAGGVDQAFLSPLSQTRLPSFPRCPSAPDRGPFHIGSDTYDACRQDVYCPTAAIRPFPNCVSPALDNAQFGTPLGIVLTKEQLIHFARHSPRSPLKT